MEIISVRFRSEGKQYYFDPQGATYRPGDGVMVETAAGMEYATCVRGNFEHPTETLVNPLRPVLRLANQADLLIVERNREKEKYAFRVCQEKILEHKLEMKLVGVECAFEGTKILFFFTSEGRVDFRGLVKSLAAVFHTRIELRQIGIRDEAKLLGGLGVCGRPFCCASFLKDFQPVSIKMAKTQNLSLNPTKISGTCGRLMCCLNYEQHAYEDLAKTCPRADSFVETPDGAGTIISVNTLRETCRVRLDSAPDSLSTYHNSELRVVRNGKGKRPEGYVEPPKAELEKLRRPPDPGTEPSTSQLASALDQYMSTYQALEEAGSPAQPAGTHERGGEGNRRRHHRSSRSRGGKGDKPPERRDGKKGRSHWRRRGGGRRKPPMD
ncbi:MAG: stage 0 sporulation family protein [Ruminiclostridium sp.]|jgi:cell fate regulator YaaT (PSP1 superfamily)|nr:stage 0 sporulation family protein [Ruminiclostridium sp.]